MFFDGAKIQIIVIWKLQKEDISGQMHLKFV
jgi:hypothetical protein